MERYRKLNLRVVHALIFCRYQVYASLRRLWGIPKEESQRYRTTFWSYSFGWWKIMILWGINLNSSKKNEWKELGFVAFIFYEIGELGRQIGSKLGIWPVYLKTPLNRLLWWCHFWILAAPRILERRWKSERCLLEPRANWLVLLFFCTSCWSTFWSGG